MNAAAENLAGPKDVPTTVGKLEQFPCARQGLVRVPESNITEWNCPTTAGVYAAVYPDSQVNYLLFVASRPVCFSRITLSLLVVPDRPAEVISLLPARS